MNTKILRERLRLALWLMPAATRIAVGLGFFRWSPAFSQTDGAGDGGPVVLELFTSQGCSSCPPADALVSELGSSTRGVIPLAYHVDYWNHLGWSDPFSSRQWSERQSDYARAMSLGGEYTPQMVVGGESQFVGSDRRGIARAIGAESSASAPGRVSLHTNLGVSSPQKLQIKVNAKIERAS